MELVEISFPVLDILVQMSVFVHTLVNTRQETKTNPTDYIG